MSKKNTLPILSNVLIQLKNKKLSIIATDLDIMFFDEISEVKIVTEGSTTTSAAILYDILRKISSNSELNFDLKTENKLSLKSENLILIYYAYQQIIFLHLLTILRDRKSK